MSFEVGEGERRAARPQRRGQDDDDQDADDAAAAHIRARPRPRSRRRRGAARGPAQRRLRLRRRPRPLRPAQRPRQPALLQRASTALRPDRQRVRIDELPRASSASAAARTNGSRASPGVCGSGSTSPAACCTTPPCCSSTSRPSASTRSAPASCAPSSATSRPPARRCCSPRTTCSRPTSCRDRIAVIRSGTIVAEGTPAQLKDAVSAGHVLEVEAYGVQPRRRGECPPAGRRAVGLDRGGPGAAAAGAGGPGRRGRAAGAGPARRNEAKPGRALSVGA